MRKPNGADLLRWISENRLPAALTIFWIVALGAYGLGYLERLDAGVGGLSAVPTVELMFFAFSIAGPIAMVWVVVSLMNRTTALSESMRAQSESALALAMTVSNLQESVDGLAAGTTGRIETSLSSLEARTAASVVALDDAISDALDETRQTIRARGVDIDDQLAATGTAISEVLSARVSILDRTLESASKRVDDAVNESLTVVNRAIRQRSQTFESALEAQRREFGKRLEDQADELSRNLLGQAATLSGKVQHQADEMKRTQDKMAQTLQHQADALSGKAQDQADDMKRTQDKMAHALQIQTDTMSGKVQEQADEMKRTQETMAQALQRQAEDLSSALEHQADEIKRTQVHLTDRVSESLANSTKRLDEALGENLSRQDDGLKKATRQYEDALKSMSGEMIRVLGSRSEQIDTQLRQNQERLTTMIAGTAATVETDLKGLLEGVRDALKDMQSSLAANPPATSEELAGLLGASAENYVRPERDALSESVERLSGLEDQARSLIDKIDRTSRLNPLMPQGCARDVDDHEIVPRDLRASQPSAAVVPLPFDALPRSATLGALNWTAAVHALDTGEAAVGIRKLVDAVKSDPQIASLLALRDKVTSAIADDGVHMSDLVPEHCEADLWADFARGERGGEISMLAGIDDKVALTLTRTRLRKDAAYRETALRFVEIYIAVLCRAEREIGSDPRLVEMADSETGRAFQLLAPLTGALMPAAISPSEDLG